MTFEDCLKERDHLTLLAKAANPHMKYLNFSGVTAPGQGLVLLHHNYTFFSPISLPECSLQKELENVRFFLICKSNVSEAPSYSVFKPQLSVGSYLFIRNSRCLFPRIYNWNASNNFTLAIISRVCPRKMWILYLENYCW